MITDINQKKESKMTVRVVGASGVPVTAASPGDAVTVPAATTTVIGGVKKAATVANCTVAADGTSAGTQLNALLTSLRAAGIIV
ncbi:head fiber protein [Yersinia enterocolitica]|uniref:head fiber protein n=1 Tax=Yersinia enterocolitica TaxID=630 RepID=UPI003F46B548